MITLDLITLWLPNVGGKMIREAGTRWTTDPSTGMSLAPVGRETVQDRVYAELRRALIGGVFAPAQVLTIRELADALATSTMPVREALGRLITEQALEALPNRTIRVPPVTLARIDDLLRARILIEGEAMALAAPRMTPRAAGHAARHHGRLAGAAAGRQPGDGGPRGRAEPGLPFRDLPRLRIVGADPDDRKPVAAIRPLHPRRDLCLFRGGRNRRRALPPRHAGGA